MAESIVEFYTRHLANVTRKENLLLADCPFCKEKGKNGKAKLSIFANPSSFFFGYFRCQCGCTPGGYPTWFAICMGIDRATVPGDDGEVEDLFKGFVYPKRSINQDIAGFQTKLGLEKNLFREASIHLDVLKQLKVGYNGRYLVYPYVQLDGNVYSARCVHPEKREDVFWHGDATFGTGPAGLYNIEDLPRCQGGAMFLCEEEENLLPIKQLGFPGVAVSDHHDLQKVDAKLFSRVKTVFIVIRNNNESYASARAIAAEIGFKVRILQWSAQDPEDYSLYQLAVDRKEGFGQVLSKMIAVASPFSPFVSPVREYHRFVHTLNEEAGEAYGSLLSGFPLLDERVGGIHGINILGGGPKVGKSTFMIQIATQMASRSIPVLYYDFENGRQRILFRTFSRISRLAPHKLVHKDLSPEEKTGYDKALLEFEQLLHYFKVVNDRKLSPQIMRRHIDFIRHETRSDYTVVVVDSLHKLPFKDLSERRTGIDGWLRQMESIRDEMNVSFLVISELSRDHDGSYGLRPQMGVFKGSGDIEYSADNAMVLSADWDHMQESEQDRVNRLWLVGSREHSPGLVGRYTLDFPFWSFRESAP